MGKVELIGHYGSDEQIALAAWTSTSRELTEDKIKRIPKMIETLYSEGHKTPFERGIVHFLVEADIASHIHLIKHRHMGTNGESARYKELKDDKMYLPEDWNIEVKSNLLDFNYVKEESSTWINILEEYTKLGNFLYHKSLEELTPVLGRKRAKESARYFKTYNSVITTDCIMNMSCFANFYKLRHSNKAQKEISDIAEEMMILLENLEGNPFETTLKMIKF
jgi:flavin-dependent thymidylate synthase